VTSRGRDDTVTSPTRYTWAGTLPGMATKTKERKVETAWGTATVVDQLSLPQRSGERRFASVVELLELDRGERLVRFAYTTDGVARRGPVTLRARDLDRLRTELGAHEELRRALLGGDA
jgi:hypothetical protein